jgi:DNA-binding PadR family transcriptional regulator
MHGYDVMRALEEESGGWYRASAGSVYPTLQMLEDQGYVAVAEQDGKKVYSITDAGRKYLDENSRVVDEIIDRVSDFTSGIFREGMSELTRSFGRVANITFERAVRYRGNQEVIAQMKDILEKAARDLEGVQPRADRT